MLRRPWLIPPALPVILIWLVLRTARLPLNVLLWACTEYLDFLLLEPRDRSVNWPSLRYLWGSM
jgi:hypothetical protein